MELVFLFHLGIWSLTNYQLDCPIAYRAFSGSLMVLKNLVGTECWFFVDGVIIFSKSAQKHT
jgi:hypothetical protein